MVDLPAGMILRPKTDEGRRTVFRPDKEYKCFTAPEWGTMAHIVTDYRWLWYYSVQLESKIALLENDIGKLELTIALLEKNVDATQRGLDSMTGLLDKEHDARLQTARKASVELWAWRVGTVLGLVATAVFAGAWGAERAN